MPDLSFEQRIARLEAQEEIRLLKARYCLLCDQGYAPEPLAGLFTEDAIWDGGPFGGRHVGRNAIRAFFSGAAARFPFAAHLVMNPIITVDGSEATGTWRMIMPANVLEAASERAVIQVAAYDETYRHDGGRWLIHRLAVSRRRLELGPDAWQEL